MSELVVLLVADPGQQTGAAFAEAEAAIGELTRLDDPESLVRAWYLVTEVAAVRSDFALLEEAAGQRFELARQAGLRNEAVWAAAWRGLPLAMGPTPVEEAIGRAEHALAEFPTERPGEFHLALLYAFAGRHKDAEHAIERARRTLIELGQRTLHATMSMNAGWIALIAGEPERAERDLREGAEVLEAAGEIGGLSTVAAVLAEVLYQLGRDEEAEEWTHRSEQATLPDDVLSQALWRSTRAKVLARRGEAERAMQLSAEAVDWARRSDGLPPLGDCLSDRAEVLQLLGRGGDARPVLEAALAVYEQKGIVPSIDRTRTLLAEIPA